MQAFCPINFTVGEPNMPRKKPPAKRECWIKTETQEEKTARIAQQKANYEAFQRQKNVNFMTLTAGICASGDAVAADTVDTDEQSERMNKLIDFYVDMGRSLSKYEEHAKSLGMTMDEYWKV